MQIKLNLLLLLAQNFDPSTVVRIIPLIMTIIPPRADKNNNKLMHSPLWYLPEPIMHSVLQRNVAVDPKLHIINS